MTFFCAPKIDLNLSSLAFKDVDFTDQNIKQRGDFMELNFEGFKKCKNRMYEQIEFK